MKMTNILKSIINLRCFSVVFMVLAPLSSLVASSDSTEEDEINQPNKKNIYHERESHDYVSGMSWGKDGITDLIAHGPKPREGGLGPSGTIEISPWIKTVNWIKNMKENEELEFVFDPDLYSIYVGVNTETVPGHTCVADISSVPNPYGGNIRRKGSLFRTDELSGHFGAKWHDKIRFEFIQLMAGSGLITLHEPWVRDSIVKQKLPLLYAKKMSNQDLTNDDYRQLGLIQEHSYFKRFTDEDLSVYQDNFLRKFGNSIFNPGFSVSIHITPWSTPPSILLYEEDAQHPRSYTLKEEFRNKGRLDMQFYNPDNGFIDSDVLEGMLFDYFTSMLK